MRLSGIVVVFFSFLAMASVTGCRLPGAIIQSGDSLADRLNSPLAGEQQFTGTDSSMAAPAPTEFQEPAQGSFEGRWTGFWSRLKPSKSLSLPRTDFWSTDAESSPAEDSTTLDAGF